MVKKERGDIATRFKKGNPGRPKGVTSIPKVIKEYTRKELAEMVSYLFFNCDKKDLAEIKKDPKTSMAKLALIKVIQDTAKHGDTVKLKFILESVMGKMKDNIEITNPDGNLNKPQIIVLPSNGREKDAK